MQQVKTEDLISTSQVARELRVSEQTVRNLDRRGLLKGRRLGNGMRVFDREAVEKFKASREK